ncbi:hypothetical protein TWF225_001049 [Orbilia oligospora]|nr:hypothetical protein TWF225_001049 [Orbilia oligospora]KAF3237881.1 hypothetical protein TWF128_000763 [Orbilia oligospora]KAF3238458.1 hypothetical protein TWF217_001728 [Orbilia oligospora]KAF3283033.1 hypothetical protein TWF132_010427 [Orbilia oligospora]
MAQKTVEKKGEEEEDKGGRHEGLVALLGRVDHLLQLPLACEVVSKDREIFNEVLCCFDDSSTGIGLIRGLNTEFKRREEGVGYLVPGEKDLGVLEELGTEEVSQGMILLVEGEGHTVWDP